MENKRIISLILFLFLCHINNEAQNTHIIGSSQIEIRYGVTQGKYKDLYVLRYGGNKSQYFCYNTLMRDSMIASGHVDTVIDMLEQSEEAKTHHDDSDVMPQSSNSSDFIYRNLKEGKLSVYSSIFGSRYVYEEDIPRISWNIREDSTVTVFGYTCHYASTTFRGRKWEVWYTPDIPLDLGPWKFCGLPGLILQADCTGFIHIETCGISDKNLTPITFYNLLHRKFQLIDRRTFLKARTSPRSYPKGSIRIPDMELE
jgi:GLPGLI family protein